MMVEVHTINKDNYDTGGEKVETFLLFGKIIVD